MPRSSAPTMLPKSPDEVEAQVHAAEVALQSAGQQVALAYQAYEDVNRALPTLHGGYSALIRRVWGVKGKNEQVQRAGQPVRRCMQTATQLGRRTDDRLGSHAALVEARRLGVHPPVPLWQRFTQRFAPGL